MYGGIIPNITMKIFINILLYYRFAVSHTLQSALENGQEVRIVNIVINAAFDTVNNTATQRT